MGIENPVHLIFIAAVALIVLGPKRLPELARRLGDGVREFREAIESGGEQEETPLEPPAEAQAPAPAQVHAPTAIQAQAPEPAQVQPPTEIQPPAPALAQVQAPTETEPQAPEADGAPPPEQLQAPRAGEQTPQG